MRQSTAPRRTWIWVAMAFVLGIASPCIAQPGSSMMTRDSSLSSFRTDSATTARDSLRRTNAAAGKTPATEKIPVVKRQVEYREQIALALGMMLFIAFAMMTAQSWNPR